MCPSACVIEFSRLKAEAEGQLIFAMSLTLTAKSANKVEIRRPVRKWVGFGQAYRTARRPLRSGRGAGNSFPAASGAIPFFPRLLSAIGCRKRMDGILFRGRGLRARCFRLWKRLGAFSPVVIVAGAARVRLFAVGAKFCAH